MARNVVLVILDAVRKDYFDDYAPRLKRLADVSFEQCRSGSSCSVPSHSAMLTGQLPHESGITYTSVRYDHIDYEETFLSELPDHRTFGVSANPWASSEFGFGSFFNDFVNVSRQRRFQDGMDISQFVYDECDETGPKLYLEFLKAALRRENTAQSIANGAFAHINRSLSKLPVPKPLDDGATTICRQITKRSDDDDGQPFFCFTNFMDAHSPMQHIVGYDRSIHDVPLSWSSLAFDRQDEVTFNIDGATQRNDEFISNYRDLYAASIDYLDRKVTTLIEDIQAQTERETTFVITADHGENLGYESEEYYFGHKSSLSEGLLHVPLYIVNPPTGLYESTEDGYFSQLQMGDLLAALATGQRRDVFREAVPAELINGYMDELRPYVSEEEIDYYSRAQRCVISDDSKVGWDSLGGSVRYRLDGARSNWQEQEDTDVPIPDWAIEHFSVVLKEFCERIDKTTSYAERDDIDDNTKDRLAELGYL